MAIAITRRGLIASSGGMTVAWPSEARAQQPGAAATSRNAPYKIGPLDVLDVTVFKVPDLSKTVRVNGAGTITYPLIGKIPAAGKTTRELERDLTQRLSDKYLRSPHITVTIKKSSGQ
jgi:polysaccharide biosynthesis/export protein